MSIGDVLTVVELEEGIPSPHPLELIAMAHAIAEAQGWQLSQALVDRVL